VQVGSIKHVAFVIHFFLAFASKHSHFFPCFLSSFLTLPGDGGGGGGD
jgi:hypothetical protein